MKTKHTPGPWHPGPNGVRVLNSMQYDIACAWSPSGNREESEANARLIAVAPIGEELVKLVLAEDDNDSEQITVKGWLGIVAKAREFKAKTKER